MTYKEIIENLEKEIEEIKAFSETELGKFLEQFQGYTPLHFEVFNEDTFNSIREYLEERDIENYLFYFTSSGNVYTALKINYNKQEISVYFPRPAEDFESPNCHIIRTPTEDISLVCDKEY